MPVVANGELAKAASNIWGEDFVDILPALKDGDSH
jgi:hypothetical protein